MARYVDIDKLIADSWHLERHGESGRLLQAMSLADVQTADVVEVVRCNDCMYCKEFHYEAPGEKPYIKLMCKWSCYSHQPNDFCSYGERTESDGSEGN